MNATMTSSKRTVVMGQSGSVESGRVSWRASYSQDGESMDLWGEAFETAEGRWRMTRTRTRMVDGHREPAGAPVVTTHASGEAARAEMVAMVEIITGREVRII